MALLTGARIGSYEIVSPLGAGGMGEVYRARDTRLKRDVAIKILPDAFAHDHDRLTRFQREAELLATLNHPNIAAVYGLEQSAGSSAIVLELIDGETLAERLHRGPMRVEEALQIATQIAEALEAAHEKGIIHRDLKPANVKITPDGSVKVLDFGLAKAMETAPSSATLSHSPTLSMMATQAGVILGTAAYMSPEQAKGFPADQRSDIFSFGTVLYEMLTGRQPFHGDTAPDVLASVLVRDADLSALPPNLNPRLPELLKRCLDKTPKKRWQAVGDLRAEIEAIGATPRTTPALGMARLPLWKLAMLAALMTVAGSLLTGVTVWNLRPPMPSTTPTIARFLMPLGEGQQFTNTGRSFLSMSPSGTQLVYVANQRVYLRSMADLEARPVDMSAGPAGVTNPVFSPDGRSIAFYSLADAIIKKISVTGGAPVTICPADNPFGMSWDRDTIVYGQGSKGILSVSANGGKPTLTASVTSDEFAYGPQILPGGQHLLFTVATGTALDRWDKARIVVQSLPSGDRKTLIDGGSDGRYVPTGHLVYAVSGSLFAVPFDVARLEVRGGPAPIVEGVMRPTATPNTTGVAQFAFSGTGSLVYVPGPAVAGSSQGKLAWIDRKGVVEPLALPAGSYAHPRLSPDGKHLVYDTLQGTDAIVWMYDLSGTSAPRRLTFGGRNQVPVWSANGERVAFQSDRDGDQAIFWQRADGTGTAERLTKPEQGTVHVPESWSSDGKTLLYQMTKGPERSLWTLSFPNRTATPFDGVHSGGAGGTSIATNAAFSPDGRWVAYSAGGQPATYALFVQPFPTTGATYQITAPAAIHPLWSRDGKELFFDTGPTGFAGVTVSTQPSFVFGSPVALPKGGAVDLGPIGPRNNDISSDGQRFLVVVNATASPIGPAPQIEVVLNWFEDLKARAPTK
jgi:serine/threonine protein kinase/Tol biopolymer transport system component